MFIRDEHEEREVRSLFTRRAAVVTLAQALGFGVLGARLYQLQVMEGGRFAPLADSNRMTVHALQPIRGRIYDRAGRVLADTEEAFRLTITPSLAGDVAAVLDAVAEIVTIDEETRATVLKRARRQAPTVPIVIASSLDFEQIARVSVNAPVLPGIETELVGHRVYHHGKTMGHMVGHVGSIERFALDDDPVLRLPGMKVGKIGVELGREAALRGVAGYVRREVDARGRVVRDLERRDPERGRDIVLSVDGELQDQVLRILSQVQRGAAVVLDVETGAVAAMGTWPTADVTDLGEKPTRRDIARLVKRGDDPLFDRTIRGLYPPGSTFKMVTALAALEAGLVTPRERIDCSGTYELADQKFRCWNRGGHGPCDLHRALRESCDVYFYEIANRLGIDAIAEMARRFGLGEVHDSLGLPHQKTGIVPTAAWKRGRMGRPWFGGETLLAGIGQGYVSSSPLQLAVMTARLATGRKVEPRLIAAAGEPATIVPAPVLEVAPAHLTAVRKGMWAVVNERGGTGSQARLASGQTVAGKTGTSQVTRLSGFRAQEALPWHQRDHALFVGYAPYDAPRFAVSVIVEHGGSGGKAAAPVAREILDAVIAFDLASRPVYQLGRKPGATMEG